MSLSFRKRSNFNPRPREEGDYRGEKLLIKHIYFNPRPREEGDYIYRKGLFGIGLFQSTPS